MPIRFKKLGPRSRHFIRAWRIAGGLTQQDVADHMGCSKSTISRLENYKTPYNQDFLEALAKQLGIDVASLLVRHPHDPDGIWAVWETIPRGEKARALEVLKTLAKTAETLETARAPG